ncbi:unnamed protein product [Calypogeia fissa]
MSYSWGQQWAEESHCLSADSPTLRSDYGCNSADATTLVRLSCYILPKFMKTYTRYRSRHQQFSVKHIVSRSALDDQFEQVVDPVFNNTPPSHIMLFRVSHTTSDSFLSRFSFRW